MNEALPFLAPLDDILHSLKTLGGLDDLGAEVIRHFAKFAQDQLAPLNASGDAEGCRIKDGRVLMPKGFREAYQALAEDGWQGLTLPEDFGGQGMDALTAAGVSEIFSGANHSLQMITSLVAGAAQVLLRFGTPDQQARFLPKLASGEYLSTMCLTESGAGSDLAAIRCRAQKAGDGYLIKGEKIFISGGDQNLSAGILHLVLARTGDHGIKGLSLFVTDHPIKVTRIEEKLGLHASPTCQIAFDDTPAELIGAEGEGLRAMFTMMNHARIDVALQGVAHAARAADLARRYAMGRVQGRNSAGQEVTIDQHGDVARMIGECDYLAKAGRALCHSLLKADHEGASDLVDFLTPVAKYGCTEAGIRAADLAIQTLGGYGYLREYGAEQNWRDARICAIYEGANGIHAKALAGRALELNQGAGPKAFVDWLIALGQDQAAGQWQALADQIRQSPPDAHHVQDFMAQTVKTAFQAAYARLGV